MINLNFRRLVLLLLIISTKLVAQDEDQRLGQMVQELAVARHHFEIKYPPRAWKQVHLGWNLDDEYRKALAHIRNEKPSSSEEYQRLFKNFILSMHDYHVKPSFYATKQAFFPFIIKAAEGQYFIVEKSCSPELLQFLESEGFDPIDEPQEFFSSMEKIQPGDELVAINGVSIRGAIENIIDEELAGNRTPTGYGLAARLLFCRRASAGQAVPSGYFTVEIKHQQNKKLKIYALPWMYKEEQLSQRPMALEKRGTPFEEFVSLNFTADLPFRLFECQKTWNIKAASSQQEDLRSKGYLPPLGPVIWETDPAHPLGLYSYLYLNEQGKKIGYLYLPNFVPGKKSERSQHQPFKREALMVEAIREVLEQFQEQADALVLDINDNPGGYLFYMAGVLSLLTDDPLDVPVHIEGLIHEDIYDRIQMKSRMQRDLLNPHFTLTQIAGYPVVKEEYLPKMIAYCDELIDDWNAGKNCSKPLHVLGLDKIEPHPRTQFTKPILLLINELDFSCGDFFPSILKDNQRARLFGKTTAGAGGYAIFCKQRSRFGVRGYSITNSVGYRRSGKPIENLGVSPDVEYELTRNDLQNNYFDYIRAVNLELYELMKNNG